MRYRSRVTSTLDRFVKFRGLDGGLGIRTAEPDTDPGIPPTFGISLTCGCHQECARHITVQRQASVRLVKSHGNHVGLIDKYCSSVVSKNKPLTRKAQ